MTARPKVGVLAVVWQAGSVLLVKRAKAPDIGHWGFPGGHLEHGESVAACAERELLEETGVRGRAEGQLPPVELVPSPNSGDGHYILLPVRVAYAGGTATAQSDAAEARWFAPNALPAPLCAFVDRVVAESRG